MLHDVWANPRRDEMIRTMELRHARRCSVILPCRCSSANDTMKSLPTCSSRGHQDNALSRPKSIARRGRENLYPRITHRWSSISIAQAIRSTPAGLRPIRELRRASASSDEPQVWQDSNASDGSLEGLGQDPGSRQKRQFDPKR